MIHGRLEGGTVPLPAVRTNSQLRMLGSCFLSFGFFPEEKGRYRANKWKTLSRRVAVKEGGKTGLPPEIQRVKGCFWEGRRPCGIERSVNVA